MLGHGLKNTPLTPQPGSLRWEQWQREAHGRTFAWWWEHIEAPRRVQQRAVSYGTNGGGGRRPRTVRERLTYRHVLARICRFDGVTARDLLIALELPEGDPLIANCLAARLKYLRNIGLVRAVGVRPNMLYYPIKKGRGAA